MWGHNATNYNFCDPNDQERREDVWMHKLRTFYGEGLNMKRINK